MVLHAPFGGRINRGWGLALRKRFCRGFGFELQAAANEEAIVISLGLQHSFPLDEAFNYLHPNTVTEVLTQAVLDQPMFESRWRWNATRSLMLERFAKGKPVPPAILRMRAADLLALTFPAAIACPENMPAGDLPIPMDHPLVRQTIEDCLTEATDAAGLIEVITALRDGRLERVAVDTAEPSAFARGILNTQPYGFLDDAPLEERRTQAVLSRRTLENRSLDKIGALDPAAVERVREEAWPQPENHEEVHEALLWMGFATDAEAAPWLGWLMELSKQQRVRHEQGCWFAVDGQREPKAIILGRLEALGPVFAAAQDESAQHRGSLCNSASPDEVELLLGELERSGAVLRTRLEGRTAFCERRLLARIHRYTLDALRREIEPVAPAAFLQFLAWWQHVDPGYQLEGPRGIGEVLRQLAGFDAPARAWEASILPRRVKDYRREWLDELTLSGEFAWGRLWGGGGCAIRVTPLSFVPREDLDTWRSLTQPPVDAALSGPASDLLAALSLRGAMFPQELQKAARLVPAHVEMGLADLVSQGLVTCDSFAALRQMITPPSRRRRPVRAVGRWSLLRGDALFASGSTTEAPPSSPLDAHPLTRTAAATTFQEPRSKIKNRAAKGSPGKGRNGNGLEAHTTETDEFLARQLLRRTGVVFRRTLEREKAPITWSALIRVYRRLELRGEIRGGRFVAGFTGEQYALPEAVELLRRLRREGPREPISVASADPLNFQGILTPAQRVAPTTRRQVLVG
jgi:ATP-dependent Lhr-like helicase